MYKKSVLFLIILSFIMIFSSNFILAVEFEGEMNSSFVKSGDSDIRPIIEGNFLLNPNNEAFGMGVNAVYSDEYFSFYNIFTLINLKLMEK